MSSTGAGASGRARAVDWIRGGATAVMVQCHALALVRPDLRGGRLSALLGWLDGFVAPAFYQCAGFALALTLVRAAAGGKLASRALRSAWRTLQVLGASAAMTWLWFPILREPRWLLRIDVLGLIGLSLALLLPLVALGARRPRTLGAGLLALTAFIVLAAPLLGRLDGPLAPFLGIRTGSVFPLVPWMAHVTFGAAAGALLAGGVPPLKLWIQLALGAAATWGLMQLLGGLYPPHDIWSHPTGHLERMAELGAMAALLTILEARASKDASLVRRAVEWLSTRSLEVYVFHELWLYTPLLGFCFFDHWGKRLSWGRYALAAAALLALGAASAAVLDGLKALAQAGKRAVLALLGGSSVDSSEALAAPES